MEFEVPLALNAKGTAYLTPDGASVSLVLERGDSSFLVDMVPEDAACLATALMVATNIRLQEAFVERNKPTILLP